MKHKQSLLGSIGRGLSNMGNPGVRVVVVISTGKHFNAGMINRSFKPGATAEIQLKDMRTSRER